MIIINFRNEFNFEYDIQALIRGFYPGEDLKSVMPQETIEAYDESVRFIVSFCYFNECLEISVDDIKGKNILSKKSSIDYSDRKETKNVLKRALYDVLSEITGKELPWGTLSGIRPTKITSALLESGMNKEDVKKTIKDTYYISEEKAELSLEISSNEIEILKNIDYEKGYSIYIGIPFCPTTCLYCSFTSYPISRYKKKITDYISAVCKEIEYIAEEFKDRKLNTIYIGGGTPTTLEPDMLDVLLSNVEESFCLDYLEEFTVEAGRPDSITREKLEVIKNHKVTRISINPQTMKQETLDIIGRRHTVDDVRKSFEIARNLGFDNINMDLIMGLPGEDLIDVKNTMNEIKKMNPDSITVHSLAIKRAARLNIFKDKYKDYSYINGEENMQITGKTAREMGMEPYYLYRQKNMAGNMENVGYSTRGKAGIYNILIMEEKQPILAIGAGASTKLVYPDMERIERVENVKDVDEYIRRVDEMIERKRGAIEEWRKG